MKCIADCAELIQHFVRNPYDLSPHLLLKGPKLSGKSVVTKKLATYLLALPASIYSVSVDCVNWQG